MIDRDILDAFGLHGEPTPLSGGQNSSHRVQNAVLKPVDDSRYYEWVASIIAQVKEPQGYRLSRPMKSKQGTYVYRRWCCTTFEPGEHRRGELAEKLRVARLLHQDLCGIDPSYVPRSDDPWTKAHRIVWKLDQLPANLAPLALTTLTELLAQVPDDNDKTTQIVHSDLAGNVLFHNDLDPLVIDFSPTIAPVEYAEAILVCDSIAWEGSPLTDLKLIPQTELYREMLIRAVIFRLAVTALVAADEKPFVAEYRGYEPILKCLIRS